MERPLLAPRGGAGDLLPHAHPLPRRVITPGPRLLPQPGAARRWMALGPSGGHALRGADGQAPRRASPCGRRSRPTGPSPGTRYQGDLVAEFVEAARAEASGSGSTSPLRLDQSDYPAFRDEDRLLLPLPGPAPVPRGLGALPGGGLRQLEELLNPLRPVDLLWFDGQWDDRGRSGGPTTSPPTSGPSSRASWSTTPPGAGTSDPGAGSSHLPSSGAGASLGAA